jgi:hypothetical protein
MSVSVPALKQHATRRYLDAYKDGQLPREKPYVACGGISLQGEILVQLLRRNSLQIRTVCEAGCGVGEVLRLLQQEMPPDTTSLPSHSRDDSPSQ